MRVMIWLLSVLVGGDIVRLCFAAEWLGFDLDDSDVCEALARFGHVPEAKGWRHE